MMPAIAVFDVALLAIFIFALIVGWQQGAVSSIMAILGVVLGLVIGWEQWQGSRCGIPFARRWLSAWIRASVPSCSP